jgi:hypothetical protein
MEREDLEVIDLGTASVETRGSVFGQPEQIGRELETSGISDD